MPLDGRDAVTWRAGSRRPPAAMAVLALWALAGGAAAQGSTRAGLTIEPSVGIRATATDNVRGGGADADRSELITTVTPGLRLVSRTGRVQGSVDYGLSGVLYARDSARSTVQNRLAAVVRAEAVPNHLDINLTGSIRRQPVSALARQSADDSLTGLNQSEVRTFSVQPVLRGVLGGVVAVQASASANYTNAARTGVGSDSQSAALTLSSAAPGTVFGWSLGGTRQVSNFEGGRETTTDRVSASFSVRPDVDWLFTVRGGKERTDIASIQQQTYDNWGAGVRWTPTPRTSLSVDADHRFFGDAYAVSAQHRMRRSVWSYSGSRAVSEGSGQGVVPVRAYDLFFELFASQEPDPVLRDALVRSFLERNGLPPEAVIGGLGFLTSAASLRERHQLSLALSGQRTTVTGSVFASRSERIDTLSGAIDDLVEGAIRQQGVNVGVSHRLTPRDSLSLSASASRTQPSGDRPDSRLYSLVVGWSTRVSERANFSLSLRRSDFDGGADNDYTENALTAAFSTRF